MQKKFIIMLYLNGSFCIYQYMYNYLNIKQWAFQITDSTHSYLYLQFLMPRVCFTAMVHFNKNIILMPTALWQPLHWKFWASRPFSLTISAICVSLSIVLCGEKKQLHIYSASMKSPHPYTKEKMNIKCRILFQAWYYTYTHIVHFSV